MTYSVHLTPTYSSLNQIEVWFSKIGRDIIGRGIFAFVDDLKRKRIRYIAQRQPITNQWPTPPLPSHLLPGHPLQAIGSLPVPPNVPLLGRDMTGVDRGPFFVQTSRILLYAVYFFAGCALGAFGLTRGLLAADGKLARRWPAWVATSLATFVLAIVTFVIILSTLQKGGPGPALGTFGNVTFVLTCAASSLAFLALFTRFARKSNRLADSLDANAYGIYLFHYACVTWLQLALLDVPLSGAAKGLLVISGSVLASWALSAILSRIPVVGRILGNASAVRAAKVGAEEDEQRFLSPAA